MGDQAADLIRVEQTAEWKALAGEAAAIGGVHLRELFAGDQNRGSRMRVEAADLSLDYSKHLISDRSLALLVEVAKVAGLEDHRDKMLAGAHINTSEDRAVLHTALRLPRNATLDVDGQDVVGDVHRVLDQMGSVSDRIRTGEWTGSTGHPIKAVVNIGIGGSDLGPAMAYQALKDRAGTGIACRFVSNIDPVDLWNQTRDLDPASTLFVICSKTFTTLETLTNAAAARKWIMDGVGESAGAVARHFVAVSTNASKVSEFGIDTDNMFGFWDWVGGRYSFDAAVGFALMVGIGRDAFGELLAGFHAMDRHFASAPLAANMPVIQGLLNVWYSSFFDAQSRVVLPYSQRLSRFPAYLQQLTMESNGKSVRRDGSAVEGDTGLVYWGEPGTNGQHAFYQLLHQGTRLVPADFIGFAESTHEEGSQHDVLMANCFAQSAVLAFGRNAEEVAGDGTPPELVPHKVMPGNRPSSTIMAPTLTPSVLGQLVALYEHTVFTEGVIWGINSFDQWGVELGKVMARQLAPSLSTEAAPDLSTLDSSTAALVGIYRGFRGRSTN